MRYLTIGIKLLVLVTLLFFLVGCPERTQPEPREAKFWYINQLSDSIEFLGYLKYNRQLTFQKYLSQNDSFFILGGGVDVLLPFNSSTVVSDSIVIRLKGNTCVTYVNRKDGLVTDQGEGVFGFVNYRNYSSLGSNRKNFVLYYDIEAKDSLLSMPCP